MSSIDDLMALAIVRRLLLELGHELGPERPGMLVGPLELWMRQPREDLAGRTPAQVLLEPGGEAHLRECLRALLEAWTAEGK